MADFSNVIDQLQTNKEQNKTSLSGVNKNLAFRLGKINDRLGALLLFSAESNDSGNSDKSTSVSTVPPKPKDPKSTGFGTTEIGSILKNDIGGGIKNLTGKITDPLTSLAKSIPGFSTLGKIGKSLGKNALSAVKAPSATKKAEKDTDAATRADKDTTFLEKIFKGINLLYLLGKEGLKKSAFALGAGLGALVALLFSPLTILVAFFKTVGKELAYLKTVGKRIAGSKFFKVIGDFFGKIGKFVGKFTGLTKLKAFSLEKIKPITKGVTRITGYIKQLRNLVTGTQSTISKGGKFVKLADLNSFEKGLKSIGNTFKAVGNFFRKTGKTIGGFVTSAKTAITPVVNFFKSIITTVKGVLSPLISGFKTGFGFVTKFAVGFGTVLGKIFLPITILMAAFDFITGFIDGFKVGGIMGGLEVGLAKVFGNLLGIPLDLLKQGIAWILSKFGFEDASEALKSFSFKDLIMRGIGGLFDMVKHVINDMIETVAKIVGVFSDAGADKVRSIKFDMSKGNVQAQLKEKKQKELKMEKIEDERAQQMTESKLAKEAKAATGAVIVNNSNVIDNSSKSSSATHMSTPLFNNNPVINAINNSQ